MFSYIFKDKRVDFYLPTINLGKLFSNSNITLIFGKTYFGFAVFKMFIATTARNMEMN